MLANAKGFGWMAWTASGHILCERTKKWKYSVISEMEKKRHRRAKQLEIECNNWAARTQLQFSFAARRFSLSRKCSWFRGVSRKHRWFKSMVLHAHWIFRNRTVSTAATTWLLFGSNGKCVNWKINKYCINNGDDLHARFRYDCWPRQWNALPSRSTGDSAATRASASIKNMHLNVIVFAFAHNYRPCRARVYCDTYAWAPPCTMNTFECNQRRATL